MEESKMKMIPAVQKLFGINSFRDYQSKALESLVSGNDVFVAQPTGSGKSLIFQSLPFLYGDVVDSPSAYTHGTSDTGFIRVKKLVLVVSPLNSLIQDQLSQLKKNGIKSIQLEKSADVEVCY